MVNFNPIIKYGRIAANRFKDAGEFMTRYSDPINDGLSTTNDVISNINLGRDLVRYTRHSPQISTGFEENYKKAVDNMVENHLDKIELTQNLDKNEKKDFLKNISSDRSSFADFTFGAKPALLITGKNEYLKPSQSHDIVRRTLNIPLQDGKSVNIDNTFILNKEKTKQVIEENKILYTKRMNMDDNSTTEEIYSELIGDNSPLLKNEAHDLIGITLGYSPINSVLFQLDNSIPANLEARQNLNTYKTALLNKLYDEDSPYKDLPEGFQKSTAAAIRDIGSDNNAFNTDFTPYGYSCRNIVPDDTHTQRVIKSAINTYKNMQLFR